MSNSNEFAQFIDELRNSRSITREDFVDGVVSLRQYYRFIKGESSLKNESINALLEKLEISSMFAYEKFRRKTDNNYSNLINVYNELYKNNYDEAEQLFNTIILSDLSSLSNIKIYDFLKIKLDKQFKRISKKESVERILTMMDYPNILNKDTLSFIELSCIIFVQDDLIKKGDYRIASYTYDILSKEEELQTTEHKDYILPFQISTIKSLGKIGKYKESLNMSEKLIEEFEVYTALNIYASGIYFKAMNERNLYKDERYKTTLIKLFCLLKSQKNKQFGNEFKDLINKHFNIVESDLITYTVIKK